MESEKEKMIGVCCHDAGGANQLLALISAEDLNVASAFMEGPAINLWGQMFPEKKLCSNLEEIFDKTKCIITGTGWESDLEHRARQLANQNGIFSISVLDHWSNYADRFKRNGEIVLPDQLWVFDKYSLQLAIQDFPDLPVVLKQGYYVKQQLSNVLSLNPDQPNELLYLLEPSRSNWGRVEVGEFQALRYFLDRFSELNLPKNTKICLRPHPSDSPGKYDEFVLADGQWPMFIDKGSLSDALSRSKWVAGCQTYAMTLALKAGRIVFGTLPPWAPVCVLPHEGIIHLKDMVVQ